MMDAAEQTLHVENAPNPSAIPPEELARMTDDIVAALKTVYDPEIPVDIYELGLIYKVDIDDDRNVAIEMTLDRTGLPRGRRHAGLGGKCRVDGGRRCLVPGDDRLRSAVGPQPHVGRSPRRNEHVVRRDIMASATPRPRPQIMKLTDAAAARVREIMSKSDKPVVGLRIGVKNGGCAGMEYTMEWAEDQKPFDEVVEDKGVKVLVDAKAMMFLLGHRDGLPDDDAQVRLRLQQSRTRSLPAVAARVCN